MSVSSTSSMCPCYRCLGKVSYLEINQKLAADDEQFKREAPYGFAVVVVLSALAWWIFV